VYQDIDDNILKLSASAFDLAFGFKLLQVCIDRWAVSLSPIKLR